ncbi:MAG: succinate dehydrogenase assembly factor 2 [Holosporales bacterium]
MIDDKALIYRATHRGSKEADQVLGTFVQRHIDNLSQNEKAALDALLALDDPIIFDMLSNRHQESNPILRELLERIESHTHVLYDEALRARQKYQ